MLHLLVVDDEYIGRVFLISYIKSLRQSIRVFSAENADDAIAICKEHRIDMIFMDIEMPRKNGLEALEEIRKIEEQPSICYILTSYDKFQYAQQAIKLHVEDYLLKPTDPEQVKKCIFDAMHILSTRTVREQKISKLENKIHSISPLLEKQCAQSILLGQSDVQIEKQFKLLNIYMKSGISYILNTENDSYSKLLKEQIQLIGYTCLTIFINAKHVFFIIHNRMLNDQDITSINRLFYNLSIPYGHGTIKYSPELLIDSYNEALLTFHDIATVDYNPNYIIDELIELYTTNNIYELKEKIKEISIQIIQKEHYQKDSGFQLLQIYLKSLKQKIKTYFNFSITLPEDIAMNTLDLNFVFNHVFDEITQQKYETYSYFTKETIQYIEQNYNKAIGLDDVANHLNINSCYLSSILNKELNRSFTDLVNEQRIHNAKALIKEGIPLKKVAFVVGFRSQSYFGQIFKKLTGISPRDYGKL